MRILLALLVLGMGAGAWAVEPASPEVDRLRRENAALKAEVARLKAEVAKLTADLAAAKPAPPKATRYTPEMIVKLVPADGMPGRGERSGPKVSKANKVLMANLAGEWVRMEAVIKEAAEHEGNTSLYAFHQTTVDPAFFTDFRFEGKLPRADSYVGQKVAVIGKVKSVGLSPSGDENGPPHFVVQLSECQWAK